MGIKKVTSAVLNMIFRITVSCLVIIVVYRLAMSAYNFGYMVFVDAAKEMAPGRDITITVEMGDSAMDIGKTLEKRGLIDDAKIFFVQERLSEYKDELKPGIYTLNTSMHTSEMMEMMAGTTESEEDSAEGEKTSESGDTSAESSDVSAESENIDSEASEE